MRPRVLLTAPIWLASLLVGSSLAQDVRANVRADVRARELTIAAPPSLRALGRALTTKLAESGVTVAVQPLSTPAGDDVDVVLVTDPTRLDALLPATEAPDRLFFAADAMVLAYTKGGAFAKAVDDGTLWFKALAQDTFGFGRADPDNSVLGLRAMFVLQLAGTHYDDPNLALSVLRPGQAMPTEVLVRRLGEGSLDAALLYRSLATQAGTPHLELPVEINLGDPQTPAVYAEARVDLDGHVSRGAPIRLAAAARSRGGDGAAQALLQLLASADGKTLLEGMGYVVPPGLPRAERRVAQATRPHRVHRPARPPETTAAVGTNVESPLAGNPTVVR